MNLYERSRAIASVRSGTFAFFLAIGLAATSSPDAEAVCTAASPAHCLRAGELDPTFGTDGYIFHDFGNGSSRGAMDMVVLPDDRIVMGGSSTLDGGTNHDPTLARFSADGLLDSSFGTDGVARVSLGAGNAIIQSLALQPDGKILAAGGRDPDPTHNPGQTTGYVPRGSFLFRFEPDGSLDASFGVGGQVVVDAAPSYRRYDRVLLQSDGKILAVGVTIAGGPPDYFVERYDPSGVLDPSFGSAGIASTNDGFSWAVYERAGAALAADGKIVLAASAAGVGPFLNCALARLDGTGELDPTFGSGGRVLIPQQYGEVCNLKAVTMQADGKILASGTFYDSPEENAFALMRLNDDGTLDTSLRRGGRSLTRVVRESVAITSWAVAVQPDGRIVQGGSSGGGELDVTRHKPNGRRDRRFGRYSPRGTVRISRPSSTGTAVFDGAHAVAILSSGHILVGGNPGHQGTFGLARVLGRPCVFDPLTSELTCE